MTKKAAKKKRVTKKRADYPANSGKHATPRWKVPEEAAEHERQVQLAKNANVPWSTWAAQRLREQER